MAQRYRGMGEISKAPLKPGTSGRFRRAAVFSHASSLPPTAPASRNLSDDEPANRPPERGRTRLGGACAKVGGSRRLRTAAADMPFLGLSRVPGEFGRDMSREDQIRSSLAAPLTLAEVSSLGHQSQDAQIQRSGALLGAGPGAWNSGLTLLDSLNDRVGLARGSWRETQRLGTTRHYYTDT